MTFNILEFLSYVVVFITVVTMIFGVLAYRFYKVREKRRLIASSKTSKIKEKDKYLYFEEKKLL